MSNLFKLIVIVILFTTLFTTCDKNDDNNGGEDITIFKAMLYGSSEVPPNASAATGSTTLTFYESTKKFIAVTLYSGLTPSAGHIHNAAVGVSGPPVFPFVMGPSPITFESGVLTQEQVNELLNGRMYVNLHTTTYPNGEIRGQLIKQ